MMEDLVSVRIDSAQQNVSRELNLSSFKINIFPQRVCSLMHLVDLDLKSNFITELIPGIAHLVNLKTLNISENKLVAVHPAISALTNVCTLCYCNL